MLRRGSFVFAAFISSVFVLEENTAQAQTRPLEIRAPSFSYLDESEWTARQRSDEWRSRRFLMTTLGALGGGLGGGLLAGVLGAPLLSACSNCFEAIVGVVALGTVGQAVGAGFTVDLIDSSYYGRCGAWMPMLGFFAGETVTLSFTAAAYFTGQLGWSIAAIASSILVRPVLAALFYDLRNEAVFSVARGSTARRQRIPSLQAHPMLSLSTPALGLQLRTP